MRVNTLAKRLIGGILLLLISSFCFAAQDGLVGKWETRDQRTHVPNSVIQIWKANNGMYYGKVVKIHPVNGAKTSDICVKCKGAQHNKPMLGLVIIRGVQAKGNSYENGIILDPRDGKEYHCILKISPDGSKLYVRGYIGVPFLGKTDTWYRVGD